jgi:hypothetical protein
MTAIFESPDTIDLADGRAAGRLARFYERIGDHAVTIGERVQYLVTGRDHAPRLRLIATSRCDGPPVVGISVRRTARTVDSAGRAVDRVEQLLDPHLVELRR